MPEKNVREPVISINQLAEEVEKNKKLLEEIKKLVEAIDEKITNIHEK